MTWVQVVSDSAFEESCILRNYGKPASKIEKPDGRRVQVVDRDISSVGLDDPEQGQRKGRFSGPSTADDADLLMRFDMEVYVFEDQV